MKQLPPDTPEQSLITQYKGPRLVVKAYAGTGKTTTLVKYAHNNLDSRILYLAYNRAIRDEAREKFPANVDCKTSHQLAYATIGRGYQHKLSGNLRLTDMKWFTEFGHLNRGDMLTSEQHRCHNEKKKFQRRV